MAGVPSIHFLVEHQQRELHDPQEFVSIGRDAHLAHLGQFLGAIEAYFAENLAGVEPLVGGEQDEVALLDGEFLLQRSLLGVAEKLDDRRLPLTVLDLDVGQPLGAKLLA